MDKERLRKFHGIPESTSQPDLKVLNRRRFHEIGAKWAAKWSGRLGVFFSLIGFFIILLPTLSMTVKNIIIKIPLLATIFHDYSTLSGLFFFNFLMLGFSALVKGILGKHNPGGHFPLGFTYKEALILELYPMTIKEEFAFWSAIFFEAVVSTVWLFFPFGVIAFIVKSGV